MDNDEKSFKRNWLLTHTLEITAGLGKMITQSDGLVQDAMGTSEASLHTTAPSSSVEDMIDVKQEGLLDQV